VVYQKILEGKGFGIEHARPSIELVYDIRNSKLQKNLDSEKIHNKLKD